MAFGSEDSASDPLTSIFLEVTGTLRPSVVTVKVGLRANRRLQACRPGQPTASQGARVVRFDWQNLTCFTYAPPWREPVVL